MTKQQIVGTKKWVQHGSTRTDILLAPPLRSYASCDCNRSQIHVGTSGISRDPFSAGLQRTAKQVLSLRGVAGRERVTRLGVADLCRGLAGLCRSRVSRRVMRWTMRGDPFGVPPGQVLGVVRGVLGVAGAGPELFF